MKRKPEQTIRKGSIKKAIKNYIEALRNHRIPVNEVILFGSCARGGGREESDIDVAIVSEAFSGDRFEDRRRMVPLRGDIDSRIEPIPLTLDEFASGRNLIDEIKRTGVKIAAKHPFRCLQSNKLRVVDRTSFCLSAFSKRAFDFVCALAGLVFLYRFRPKAVFGKSASTFLCLPCERLSPPNPNWPSETFAQPTEECQIGFGSLNWQVCGSAREPRSQKII